MQVELKNLTVSKALSEETTAFTATIYIDGVKAGNASNRGHGAQTMVHILDPNLRAKLHVYVAGLPPVVCKYFPEGYAQTVDSFIDDLVVKAQEQKWLKRTCRKKTVFQLAGDEPGVWNVLSVPFSPTIEQQLRQKHGTALVRLVNLEFAQPARAGA